MLNWLVKLFKKKEPKCEHKEVIKGNYGGFFDFDTYTCTECNQIWDESVIFAPELEPKLEYRAIRERIISGKTKVIK